MIREVLRGALNAAVKMQMVERNVATLAPAPRQVKTERRVLSAAEAGRLLTETDQDRLAALYRLALSLGMRQAKFLLLRWDDVDLEAGTLRVRQTLQRIGKETFTKEPKTARSRRTLALSPSLVATLTAHKDRQTFHSSDRKLATSGPRAGSSLPLHAGRRWALATSCVPSSAICWRPDCGRRSGSMTCAPCGRLTPDR